MTETPCLINLVAISAVIELAEKLGFDLAHTKIWYSGYYSVVFALSKGNGDEIKLTVSVETERKTSN